MKDPVDIDELRHDVLNIERRERQDILEKEFLKEPDWDAVAEHLRARETIGEVLGLVCSSRPYYNVAGFNMIRLALAACAREHAERNVDA